MNREEAIKHLETYSTTNGLGQTTQAQHEEAKRMGIKALEQEPCGNAIDRAEAIKIASGYCHPANIANELAKLPSVNPQPCEEAISRQAVLDMATTIQTDDYSGNEIIEVVDVADVKALPPVTPQPKTGHWIDDNENEIDAQYGIHLYKCSECDEYASAFVGGTEDWWDIEKPNYCPNCGSRMVEPQESEENNG